MAKKVISVIKLQIPAGKATPAPPVGTALGPAGVNLMDFCKTFNARTEAQAGLIIPVVVTVYADRSYTFITKPPPASILLIKAAGIVLATAGIVAMLIMIVMEKTKDIGILLALGATSRQAALAVLNEARLCDELTGQAPVEVEFRGPVCVRTTPAGTGAFLRSEPVFQCAVSGPCGCRSARAFSARGGSAGRQAGRSRAVVPPARR